MPRSFSIKGDFTILNAQHKGILIMDKTRILIVCFAVLGFGGACDGE